MSREQRTHAFAAPSEQEPRPLDTATRLRQLLGLRRDEPAIRMEDLAKLRGFPSGAAARQFLMRHREYIAFRKIGRRVVVTLADFDHGCQQLESKRRKRA